MVTQIEIWNAPDDTLEVTLRGEATALIHALVNGLDRDSLVAIKEALDAEMAKRTADRS